MKRKSYGRMIPVLVAGMLFLLPDTAMAGFEPFSGGYTGSPTVGGVYYGEGFDALVDAHKELIKWMSGVCNVLFAIGAICSILGAMPIFFKMNRQEGDITKSILMLVGGILFLLGATIVLPGFFGFENVMVDTPRP